MYCKTLSATPDFSEAWQNRRAQKIAFAHATEREKFSFFCRHRPQKFFN